MNRLTARIERLERVSLPLLSNGGIIIVTVRNGESEADAKARTLESLGLTERQPGLCFVFLDTEDMDA